MVDCFFMFLYVSFSFVLFVSFSFLGHSVVNYLDAFNLKLNPLTQWQYGRSAYDRMEKQTFWFSNFKFISFSI